MGIRSKIKSLLGKGDTANPFVRVDLDSNLYDGIGYEARKIVNLLNYTKTSGASYSADLYDVGYHTICLDGKTLGGQRDPRKRLENLDYDFSGKTCLDLGCNQGGMLHAIADEINYGLGLDYDSRMVNVGNRIAHYKQSKNLQFYVFDLQNEPLDLIYDFSAVNSFDIVFMLSISMWIDNWKEVLAFGAKIGKSLLFETNGTEQQQKEQHSELTSVFRNVTLLSSRSEDDPRNKRRQLFLCKQD